MGKLYTLSAQLTRDRLLVEPDVITAEYDAESIAAQQTLVDANAAYQDAVQARRALQQKLGVLTGEASNLRQQIRDGMKRALESEADAAFYECEKMRVRRARKLAQIQYMAILISASDLAIKRAEITVLEASADAREEEVAAKKLRLMLAGAAARAVTGGATIDVGPELAHVEKVIARDRESVLPGLSQELALAVEKHNAAVESVDGIYS